MKLIAEISGNHNQNFERAKALIEAAKNSGADLVKLQTYTPETITIKSDRPEFVVSNGHKLWGKKNLWELYEEAHTPWEWHEDLFQYARSLGIEIFSTPFDETAVDFLEDLGVNYYKIASLESSDVELIRKIGNSGKPTFASTGASTLEEIDLLVNTFQKTGNSNLTLLLCTSAYPTPLAEVNFNRVNFLRDRYNLPIGLSDHTLGIQTASIAVAMGLTVLEKHLTLSRGDGGPDSGFSTEPHEFLLMKNSTIEAMAMMGQNDWPLLSSESESRRFRRSLFVVQNVRAGDVITHQNVKSKRPHIGLEPVSLDVLLGKYFTCDITAGTPLTLDLVK
jgi:N-acetylneuraminate synthase